VTAPRTSATERGNRAEDAVASYLVQHGYTLLGRNVRVGKLEVDIVARKGDVVCICEVRLRRASAYATPFASLDARKQERLLRAAEALWSQSLRDLPGEPRLRIDVAGVTESPAGLRVDYIEGALTGEGS
jgi:putative endonuclease